MADGVRRAADRDPPLVARPAPRPLLPRRRGAVVAPGGPSDRRPRLARRRPAHPRACCAASGCCCCTRARGPDAATCCRPTARSTPRELDSHPSARRRARRPRRPCAGGARRCYLARPARCCSCARRSGAYPVRYPPCRATTSAAASAPRPSRSTAPWAPRATRACPHGPRRHGQAAHHGRRRRPQRRPRADARARRRWRLLRGRLRLRLIRRGHASGRALSLRGAGSGRSGAARPVSVRRGPAEGDDMSDTLAGRARAFPATTRITSANGRYHLRRAVRRQRGASADRARRGAGTWAVHDAPRRAASTCRPTATWCSTSTDGGVAWASNTSGQSAYAQDQDDRNVVLYNGDGSVLWSPNSYAGQR